MQRITSMHMHKAHGHVWGCSTVQIASLIVYINAQHHFNVEII